MAKQHVKHFDYWAFHDDGSLQFFHICEGVILDYREYARIDDAPILILGDGPPLRYHGRSYIAHLPSEVTTDEIDH